MTVFSYYDIISNFLAKENNAKYPTCDPTERTFEVGVNDLLDDDGDASLQHGVEEFDHEDEASAHNNEWNKQKDDASFYIWEPGVRKQEVIGRFTCNK